MARKLKKLLKKALPLAALGLGAAAMGRNRRNKAIDAGIAAADEEPGAQIKDFGPYSKAKNFVPEKRIPKWTGDQTMTSDWPFYYKKGGRVTGAAKRGFGRALMKGKK